jgi:hypothetical protein
MMQAWADLLDEFERERVSTDSLDAATAVE